MEYCREILFEHNILLTQHPCAHRMHVTWSSIRLLFARYTGEHPFSLRLAAVIWAFRYVVSIIRREVSRACPSKSIKNLFGDIHFASSDKSFIECFIGAIFFWNIFPLQFELAYMDNTVENSLSSPRARKEWTNSVHFRGRKIKKGPTGIAGGSSYAPVRLCYQQRPGRRITIWHLHFCYLRPVNGLPAYGVLNSSPSLSPASWCLMYSAIFALFLPTVST